MQFRLLNLKYYRDNDQAVGLSAIAHKELTGEIPSRAQASAIFDGIGDDGFVMGAFDNDRLVGMVMAAKSPPDSPNHYDVKNMYVACEYRKRKIGKHLMESLLSVLDVVQPDHVSALDVDANMVEIMNLYQRFNYENTGQKSGNDVHLRRRAFSHIFEPKQDVLTL